NFLFTEPWPNTLRPAFSFLTTPAPTNDSAEISAPSSKRSFNVSKFTIAYFLRLILVNPSLGRRCHRGICPPTNPGLTPPPVRAFCPLCPRPDVFPLPEDIPRPTRLRVLRAPSLDSNS